MNKERFLSIAARLSVEAKSPLSEALSKRKQNTAGRNAIILAVIASIKASGMADVIPLVCAGGKPSDSSEVIGMGSQQVVFRDPDVPEQVTKMRIGSQTTHFRTAAELARQYQNRHDNVAQYLGGYCVESEFVPARLTSPVSTLWGVSCIQPFISDHKNIFARDALDAAAVETLQPVNQAREFADKAREMQHEQGYYVDLIGEGNLVGVSGDLLLLDTIPVSEQAAERNGRNGKTVAVELQDRLQLLAQAA